MPLNSPKCLPYWNSTSSFDFDHITAVDMSFCTSLRNFIQVGPPSAEKNDVMSIFKMVNFHYTGLYRSSIETIALNCLVFEKIACLHFGDRQTDGQSQRIKPLSSWQLVHEWSTFVDDTQTGWDQTLYWKQPLTYYRFKDFCQRR